MAMSPFSPHLRWFPPSPASRQSSRASFQFRPFIFSLLQTQTLTLISTLLFFMHASPCSTRTLLLRSLFTITRSLTLSSTPSARSLQHLATETMPSEEDLLNSSSSSSSTSGDSEVFPFDKFHGTFTTTTTTTTANGVEVKENREQWRRARLAWLCKELPRHKAATLVRVLNAQKKWMRHEDAAYVVVNCMRHDDTGFRVYKWMMQQHWYRFDFALATKLADYMGKEQKFSKCREIFDDIIDQGCVPSESTFHILIAAYLCASVQGCLDEACIIYNRMIQLGGYQPCLSLHNSLFKALVSRPGNFSKHYLKQAEFIFRNLVAAGLDVHKDIYEGLIWLHSYQDTIDKERIAELRKEMQQAGIEEGREVLLSILRASAREGEVVEAEKTWLKLLQSESNPPLQAFVYKMEVYSKVGMPLKSLEIFREMQGQRLKVRRNEAHNKIIEILCKHQQIELAESIMADFVKNGLKTLTQSYAHLLNMYFDMNLHDKLEVAFSQCLEKCCPNSTVYTIYLDSLVKIGNFVKAEDIFNQMKRDETIGVNALSCNIILSGYLSSGNYIKAEELYDFMCQKKYEIETQLMEKLEYILSLRGKLIKKPVSLKLSKEKREMLIGLLLGGLQIDSDDERKNHIIHFDFNGNFDSHDVLKSHIYGQFYEWLHPSCKPSGDSEKIPDRFCTIASSYFGFYADQFSSKGQPTIPKLVHRWMSPCVLAYWYMYGGHRSSAGDVLLKIKGSHEGVDNIVKKFKAMSINCRVKRKGRLFWIGILGSNSTWFWKLVEPYILENLKDVLRAGDHASGRDSRDTLNINFNSDSDTDE